MPDPSTPPDAPTLRVPSPDPSGLSAPDRLAERATEFAATATAALGTAADTTGDFVRRQQPLVMAAAFGLGVFLGLMLRRR